MKILNVLDLFYKIKRDKGCDWKIDCRQDTMIDFVIEVRNHDGEVVLLANHYDWNKACKDMYYKLKKIQYENK